MKDRAIDVTDKACQKLIDIEAFEQVSEINTLVLEHRRLQFFALISSSVQQSTYHKLP